MKSVAVITRTKDRPITLRRALDSVCGQTFTDFDWILVNDGGSPEPVEEIVRRAKSAGLSASAWHNPASIGLTPAANQGMRAAQSKYVVLHDDDDSWEPDFLQQTVAFMEKQPPDSLVRGVVTRSIKVEEVIEDGTIVIKGKGPLDPWLEMVTLFRMANTRTVPPPISFLYRRDVFEDVGHYREDLQVLEDWEFYLRFLRRYDIGVIPRYLANYHWRATVLRGAYSNTCVAAVDVHAATTARIRNEMLRQDLDNKELGMGFLVNLVQELHWIEHTARAIRHEQGCARVELPDHLGRANATQTAHLVGEMERVAEQTKWALVSLVRERLRKVPLLRLLVR